METLGDRIKKLRTDMKLSQAALAHIIGVSDVTVGYWEKDQNEPSMRSGYEMCFALGTTIDYLMTGKNRNGQAVNRDLLVASIRDIEEAAAALKRKLEPETKAAYIMSRYELGANPSFSDVMGLFQTDG